MKTRTKLGLGALALAASPLALAPSVSAQGATTDYQASLSALNDSGVSGTAMVEVTGDQLRVTVTAAEASAGLPHAQHIHIGGANVCPTSADDTDGDGFVSTPEGQPRYGPIMISLTTEGDTSPESGLAVDRMPVADASGQISYMRGTIPPGMSAADIAKGVIVSHGHADTSLGSDMAGYDGPDSALMAGVPMEATLPIACGKLTAMPAGGMQTGGGGTAAVGDESSSSIAYLVTGGVAVALGGIYLARRRLTAES